MHLIVAEIARELRTSVDVVERTLSVMHLNDLIIFDKLYLVTMLLTLIKRLQSRMLRQLNAQVIVFGLTLLCDKMHNDFAGFRALHVQHVLGIRREQLHLVEIMLVRALGFRVWVEEPERFQIMCQCTSFSFFAADGTLCVPYDCCQLEEETVHIH